MSLTSTQGPLTALETVLRANLPTGWTLPTDPGVEPGTLVVEPVTSPQPTGPTLGGLHETSTALFQLTGHAPNRRHARQAADHFRTVLIGQTGRKPTNPLTLVGFVFDPVTTLNDLRITTTHQVHTFTETFRVVWQVIPPA